MSKLLMHNPDRRKYARGERPNNACYFCGEEMKDQHHIKEYKYWALIANKFPFIDFAMLAIPKRHIEFLTDLTMDEWMEFKTLSDEVLGAWKKYYLETMTRSEDEKVLDKDRPSWNLITDRWPPVTYQVDEEMTMYVNNGEHSGRTVPHLHWNIVPRIYIRRTGLESMNWFQKVKIAPEETADLFKKLLNQK